MRIHEASDAATRAAIFKAAIKEAKAKGITNKQHQENFAVMRAREIMNFSKKGNSQTLATIRAVTPFFSSQLNAMDTLARAAFPGSYGNLNKTEAAEVNKRFLIQGASLFTISMAIAFASQDNEEYKKSPDWVNSWLIPTGNKENPFIKVPIPFEAGFFFKVLPEYLVRMSSGTLSTKQGNKALGTAAIQLLAPVLPLNQLVKPAWEAVANYDVHTQNPIESMSESRLPREYRDAHASQLSKIVGRALPISPDKIEHLGHGYLTEAWGLAAAISDAYLHTEGVAPPKKAYSEMPMFKGVLTAPEKDRAVGEFYEITKKTGQIRNAIRSAQKEGDKETVARLKADPENIKLSKAAPMLQKESVHISKAQQRIKRIKNDPDLSGEEKTKLIRVQQHRINTIAERGLKKGERKGLER
jgi:hypothetical protein